MKRTNIPYRGALYDISESPSLLRYGTPAEAVAFHPPKSTRRCSSLSLLLLLFFWRIQPKKNSRKQRRKSRRREPLHPQQPRSLRLGADSFIDWRTVHRGCCSQCVVFNLPQWPYRLYASRNRRSKLDGGLLFRGHVRAAGPPKLSGLLPFGL